MRFGLCGGFRGDFFDGEHGAIETRPPCFPQKAVESGRAVLPNSVAAYRVTDNRGGTAVVTMKRVSVAVLALVFVLAGCGEIDSEGEDGYTFRFKVDNNTHLSGGAPKTINKVEFINGDTRNDDVLFWSSQPISPGGERSMQYTARGFTIEYTSGTRIFGVQVMFEDGTKVFKWSYAGHNEKILVSVNPPDYYNASGISFSPGNW